MSGTSVFSLFTVTQLITDLSNKIASTAWVKSLGSSTPINIISSPTYSTTGYEDIWCATNSNAITITLPSSPSRGMKIGVTRYGTNVVVINNNSKSINYTMDTFTIDKDKSGLWLIWNPTDSTWMIELRTRG